MLRLPLVLGLVLAGAPLDEPRIELDAPFVVEADGRAIDVPGGNSAPFFHDLDGDGLRDLLVGQFEDGCVRVYKNVGARGAPRFAGFELLRAGGELAKVPYG